MLAHREARSRDTLLLEPENSLLLEIQEAWIFVRSRNPFCTRTVEVSGISSNVFLTNGSVYLLSWFGVSHGFLASL